MGVLLKSDKQAILDAAKRLIDTEQNAINALQHQMDDPFLAIVDRLKNTRGRVILSGIGKSGYIAQKIASTFASTGTPSFFIHPADALHGDLGAICSDDTVILISYSGESREVISMIPIIQKTAAPIIAITGQPDSTLANASQHQLNIAVTHEGCTLNLAPMASSTATLVIGDALAAALIVAKNFRVDDFALYHPGGSLGARLLTTVGDRMRTHSLPIVQSGDTFQTIIHTMTGGRMGMCLVDQGSDHYGLITDGDLRRALERTKTQRFEITAEEIMTPNPIHIEASAMAAEAKRIMMEKNIKELLVTHDGQFIGVIQLYDIGEIV